MVFINNSFDVTLSPGPAQPLRSGVFTAVNKTFEQAVRENHIYKGNGAICEKKMCGSLVGCESNFGCPSHPDWKRVQEFCGPFGTPAMYDNGSLWLRSTVAPPVFEATQEQELGLKPLPNPYNVMGMY